MVTLSLHNNPSRGDRYLFFIFPSSSLNTWTNNKEGQTRCGKCNLGYSPSRICMIVTVLLFQHARLMRPRGTLPDSCSGPGDWCQRAFFIMENVLNCPRPFLGRNSMFWPLREKLAVSPVELRRHSSSYGKAMEEQVGQHTSLMRGSVSFSK